jgi:hypothetical protein
MFLAERHAWNLNREEMLAGKASLSSEDEVDSDEMAPEVCAVARDG